MRTTLTIDDDILAAADAWLNSGRFNRRRCLRTGAPGPAARSSQKMRTAFRFFNPAAILTGHPEIVDELREQEGFSAALPAGYQRTACPLRPCARQPEAAHAWLKNVHRLAGPAVRLPKRLYPHNQQSGVS